MPSKKRPKASLASDSVNEEPELDDLDLRILDTLGRNPRISMSELAKNVRMSRPAVVERVRRMESKGVISGWRVDFNPAKLGLPLTCYIRIRPLQGHLSTIANLVRELPQVVECHRITGEDCFLVKANVSSVGALELIIDRFLPYGQTTTSIVQSSPVPVRLPPLPELEVSSKQKRS
ncbi:MAG: Lrp/AsnC family transcriptional regulator [archaeon]|nr:MAG: Lrp/AsnC family transcriptional regulator [archaeon]